MASLENLDNRIRKAEERNIRVEKDKLWELSYTRRLILILFAYLAIGYYLRAIQVPKPWLNAIVPAFAFMLSTLTLPFIKKFWQLYFFENKCDSINLKITQ